MLCPRVWSQAPSKIEFESGGENTVSLKVDGKPLLTYVKSPTAFDDLKVNEYKTYLSQLYTPEGRNVLRDSPADHVHHHSLMFAISADDVNFWEEMGKENAGVQFAPTFAIHSNVVESDGKRIGEAVIDQNVAWFKPDKSIAIREDRTIRVFIENDLDATLLDWSSKLSVGPNRESVKLSGSHYYGLGMRFDQTMDKNGTFFCDTGSEIPGDNVRGDEKKTTCKWMAYTADLHGKPATVAVFDAPENPRPMSAFTMGQAGQSFAYISATVDLEKEPITLEKGKPLTFEYGVAAWDGKKSVAEVQKLYQTWLEKRKGK